ncbi:MAG: (2Fe-2S)-binding protein [Gemmataceae bacterium]|nr:(2Fe-2S)-binding protein [Gemmataceae bacterium]
MGIIEPCDERDEVLQVLQPQRRIYCKLIVRHGRLAGAILVGDTTAAASLSRRLIRGDLLPHNRLDLLASPYRGGLEEDEEVICHCYQLSQQQVQQAIRQGCHTLAELSSRTGAGTGCGGCRGRLTHLLLRSMPTAEMTS